MAAAKKVLEPQDGPQVAPRPVPPPILDPAVGDPIPSPEAPAVPALPADIPGLDPVIGRPILHAFALVPDPARPGRYFAVGLSDVVAGSYTHLEPSGRSDMPTRGMLRIEGAMQARHRLRAWEKP